jgi:hypothetical protein
MTTLIAGQPFITRTPTVLVENTLTVGTWIFQLVVVDDDGNQSAPQQLSVTVEPARRPPPPRPLPTPTPIPTPRPGPNT